MRQVLCAIFFASGAAALVFETLWFRQAGLGFGNSVWASSLVLAGFMGGLALGNLLVARWGDRFGNPVKAYAIFEAAIGITGVALVFVLPHLGAWLAAWMGPLLDQPWILNPLRLLVAFALLLVPSTAMGATLPLLTKPLTATGQDFGRVLGWLYGFNTLGAVCGVVAAEGFLIGAVGVRGAALAAGAVNVTAALVALAISMRFGAGTDHPQTVPSPRIQLRLGRRWLAAAFGSGFMLLALEVIWFRFLALYIVGHTLALALMLGTVLAGIGMGGLAASAWLRRDPHAYRASAVVALVAGTLCAMTYACFPWVVDGVGPRLAGDAVSILRVGLPLILPVSFCSGVFFVLAGAGLREALPTEITTAGVLTFANTTGAALGSLVGGFVLLPTLGMEGSFFVLALGYGFVAIPVWAKQRGFVRLGFGCAVALAATLVFFPFGSLQTRHLRATVERWSPGGRAEVVLVREGLAETVIYLDNRVLDVHHSYRLVTDGYSMSTTDNRNRRYMKLFVYLPVAVHPDPRSALLISYGVGSTARAFTDTGSLQSIDIVDISRGILEASRVVYPDPKENPLFDPRVRVHVEDGRYFLQTTDRTFDLITAEPPPPGQAGVVNLYTREYFQLIYDRLAAGGIATYWLPLHDLSEVSAKSILRGFGEVFEDCSLWNGSGLDLMMVGTRNAPGPVSGAHFRAQWQDPVVGPELRELGLERPEQLGALFIGGAEFLRKLTSDTPPLVDDYPKRVRAPSSYPGGPNPVYRRWRNVNAAAERFRKSPLIARLWPQPMREATLEYFRHQGLINQSVYVPVVDLDRQIEGLHAVLSETDLRTPVLWALKSDADIQRVMDRLGPADRLRPELQFHLGAHLLAERRYAEAVEPLRRAEAHRQLRRDAFRLRVYALCQARRQIEAEQLARRRYDLAGSPHPLPTFWTWMTETFGLDPTGQTLSSLTGVDDE